MSSTCKNWSDATWWLDDNHVGLEWDYHKNKLEVTTPPCFNQEQELGGILKEFHKELKRFILETDAIRRQKDAAHRFDD